MALVSGRPEPPSGYNYPRPGGGHHHIGSVGIHGGGGFGNNFQTISSGHHQTSFGNQGGDFGGNTGFTDSHFGGQSSGSFGGSSVNFGSSSGSFGGSSGSFGERIEDRKT